MVYAILCQKAFTVIIFILILLLSIKMLEVKMVLINQILYIFDIIEEINKSSMSNLDIVLDPIALLEMSGYFEKNIGDTELGATFGLIYGQQVELKYHISLSAPLGTHLQDQGQLIKRAAEYEKLRLKRSKSTVNFYEQYTLLGLYILRPMHERFKKFVETQDQKALKISEQLDKNGAPYALIVDSQAQKDPILLMNKKPCSYTTEIKKNERLCLDSMESYNANELTVLRLGIEKKRTGIQVFNEKLLQILKKIEESKGKNSNNHQKHRILEELLNNYDRISKLSTKNKKKAINAMNYSVVTGIVIDRLVN